MGTAKDADMIYALPPISVQNVAQLAGTRRSQRNRINLFDYFGSLIIIFWMIRNCINLCCRKVMISYNEIKIIVNFLTFTLLVFVFVLSHFFQIGFSFSQKANYGKWESVSATNGLIEFRRSLELSSFVFPTNSIWDFDVFLDMLIEKKGRWPGLAPKISNGFGFINTDLLVCHYTALPIWFITFLWSVPALNFFYKSLKKRKLLQLGYCPNCGYDWRFNSGLCPECGTTRIDKNKTGIIC